MSIVLFVLFKDFFAHFRITKNKTNNGCDIFAYHIFNISRLLTFYRFFSFIHHRQNGEEVKIVVFTLIDNHTKQVLQVKHDAGKRKGFSHNCLNASPDLEKE